MIIAATSGSIGVELTEDGKTPIPSTSASISMTATVDQEWLIRSSQEACDRNESSHPFMVQFLLDFIRQRDQIIHDLMLDKGMLSQDALPPNMLRQENEALRARIAALEQQVEGYADAEERARQRQQELRDDAKWHF